MEIRTTSLSSDELGPLVADALGEKIQLHPRQMTSGSFRSRSPSVAVRPLLSPAFLQNAVPAEQPFAKRADRCYTIADFTKFQDRAFIVAAYRGLCERAPDPVGLAHYLALLRAGHSKIEILARLRFAPEGKRVSAKVPYLMSRAVWAIAADVPLLGLLCAGIDLLLRGRATARSTRRLEAHVAALAELQTQQLANLVAEAGQSFQLLQGEVHAMPER